MGQDTYVDSFDAFMRAWLDRAVRYCVVLCRDPELAEEVVQTVFVNMFNQRATPWAAESAAGFLFRSVRNGLIDARKRAARTVSADRLAELVIASDSASPDAEALATALLQLTDDHREVLGLRYFDALSLVEIGRIMDRSAGAVNKLLARAKAELRSLMHPAGRQP